jgi:hypothetical protein
MINVTYSNLRSCLEAVVAAHIIENLDDEAKKFLEKGEIDPTKIALFVPEQYNKDLNNMRHALSELGVHTRLHSIQLSSLFGPNALDKMVSHVSTKNEQDLHPAFAQAANTCIQAIGEVFLMFMFLMHKGTTFKADKK